MSSFYCQKCGAVVGADDNRCKSCGSTFSSVMCPKCQFSGRGSLFHNGCPKCGYLSKVKSRNRIGLKLFFILFSLLIITIIYLISIF